MDKHLHIEPQELSFPFQLKKQVSCLVRLYNKTPNHVAFKVMTTSPKKYCVQPNMGIVLPGSACDVTVIMYADEAPQNMQCKDKFLVKSAFASAVATTQDIQTLLDSKVENLVQKCKLGVIYTLPPQPPSPVIISTSVKKLLDVKPSELHFPFELKKQLSCSFHLLNMTENHVAFKVKTTDPKKYCVQPNMGIVLPRSTFDVIVKMQAQTKIPVDGQCKDKFLIQSVLASPADTTETITPQMFEAGRIVDEFKLKVAYTFPPHPQSSNYADSSPERNCNDTTQEVHEVDKNETRFGDLVVKGIIIGLFGLIFWYLFMKLLPLIWSLTFVMMMLAVKMIRSVVSDSVEDWIVKSLVYICCHFVPPLFMRIWNAKSSS